MDFSVLKSGSNAGKKSAKRGKPIEKKDNAGLGTLFRRKKSDGDEILPVGDINAGLSRALRAPKVDKKSDECRENDLRLIRSALTTIEAVLYAMDKAREILQQCYEVASSAKNVEDPGARALLADSYDELRLSIDTIVDDTDPSGVELIGPDAQNLDIEMSGRARYSLAFFRLHSGDDGLKLSPPFNAFDTDEEIDALSNELKEAYQRVERATAAYCRDAKYLMARINEFTQQSSQDISENEGARRAAIA